ncbi:response regulator [Novosphingobium album (ex Liu et al. 2023)]|uniref:Response regulator n=1 Tax=Novosphingobium album (ex Liu et al. 2023) TaxID=3031130 RepID=A0ABT5WKP3_9SPHN|nr:response regulator [Novosphingobium album (ex Liu et al. 2023)]MDE8650617.1 response regulator [Novosphingobium album (ex Liu et al. 2023)]
MSGETFEPSAGERPRLLLVEDDAAVRRSLQLLFRARGFDVRAYARSAALLADPSVRDACCFVADYSLDETDGIEVLVNLKNRGWSGPAVLFTACASNDLIERALASGFSQVFEKPFQGHALGDVVVRLTGERWAAAQS